MEPVPWSCPSSPASVAELGGVRRLRIRSMKSKYMAVVALSLPWLAGCSRSPSLPPGVTLHVKNGEVYLALDKDVAVNI